MAKLPGMFQRGGVWQLRVMVPLDLQEAYNGRSKFIQSLGTCDWREARLKGAQLRAQVLADLHARRCIPAAAPQVRPEAPPGGALHAPSGLSPRPLVSLRQVFERWKGVKTRSPDTVKACARALALFEDHTGDTPVQQITRPQGDAFRAWLQTLGTASKTAHDRLTWVKSLLTYACRDLELISRQPWEGLDIEHRTETPRKPWNPAELAAFYSLPLFTARVLPRTRRAGGEAAYWVPLLGLFTGARVGELCQLQTVDIIADGDDVPGSACIRITDEAEGAKVKTAAGLRIVPVHSELVRLGFLDYVTSVRQAGELSLWPSLPLRKGKPGGYFSEWFNGYHRMATRNENAPVFHELRHTVRTALHATGQDRETIARIIGHESGLSAAEKAYTHVAMSTLRAAVECLRFPAVAPLGPSRTPLAV